MTSYSVESVSLSVLLYSNRDRAAGRQVIASRRRVKYDVVNWLEVIEESSPVEDVECDEGEREEKSGEGVDLTDAVHVTSRARQRLHAVVTASTCGWSGTHTFRQGRPHVAAALPASPQLRPIRRRRQTGIVLTAAPGGSRYRRLRLPVDVLRRCQCTLDWIARGATVPRLCAALLDFLRAFYAQNWKYCSNAN